MPGRQRLSRARRAAVPVLLGLAAVALVPGCAGPVQVTAAPEGSSDACADVLALLPAELAGQPERETRGAGTAAWGDPAVLLRCGEEPVLASTQPCVSVPGGGEDVDWVVLASDDSGSIVRTFGRDPSVEVEVPATYGPAPVAVLPDLAEAVAAVPATAVCTG
ncbi:DUF3515 family protein [Aquipuribacter hungaricus]|uniref:DUF3515 family protein n=1 Tax=Aquipuribacter hungaricus TaxID=545624 RepID=UPI00366EF4BE